MTPAPEHFGIYIHFPWCLVKCPYCDFLSIPVEKVDGRVPGATQARLGLPHRAYADAIIAEFHHRRAYLSGAEHAPSSLFFGGGTPSLWEPEELGRVIDAICSSYRIAPQEIEVTVECNPTSVDVQHFERLRSVGVNRVSVGVQALDGARLQFLGRLHDPNGALLAVDQALASGIGRVSADLIYGVFQQPADAALRDLETLLQRPLTHLSAYTLTIEPGTRFGALDRAGKLPLLAEDEVARSYRVVSDYLQAQGFEHYEISNFARNGELSIHNLGYWLARPYLGLGTGAYGRIGSTRYRNAPSQERYLALFGAQTQEARKHSREGFWGATQEPLSTTELHNELLMLGLRTQFGVARSDIQSPTALVEQLLERGELQGVDDDRIRIHPSYWLVSDSIVTRLML